jgi:hypothetical protein
MSPFYYNHRRIKYRPGDQTKSPYRMVEKALTKGTNREYPDCSQILDVIGCIIECQDFVAMATVGMRLPTSTNRGRCRLHG